MMGPIYWNPQSPTHLKKCSEFISNSCTDEASLGCCGVLPCSYCLEFHPYGEPVEYGLATFTGSSWSGTIAGASFSAFWDRGLYGDGECEFVVEIDGEEVYRESCYMGQQSCRDSSDEAEATIGYKSGTLIWIKREHRPLEYVEDFDTYCMEHFCDSCECSCKTLCLTIYDPDGTQTDRGELNDVAYACDPPKWEGRVGYFDLSLALERDLYGQCIIVGTVDGEEQDPVLAPGCTGLAGEIELYDGTRIVFACKVCDCGEVCIGGCCPGIEIEDTAFFQTECGPGSLGCPDYPARSGVPCLTGLGIMSICNVPEDLRSELGNACGSFCSTENNIAGSLGSYEFDVVLACTGTGTTGRAFIMYHGTPPPGLMSEV